MQASRLGRVLCGVVVAFTCVGHLAAQQPVTIQWAPRPGSVVRTITSSRGSMVFREINEAGQGIGDSVMGEMTSLSGVTHRVIEAQGGAYVVGVQYDSLKTRARLVGQNWKDDLLSGAGQAALRMTLDGRLRPVEGTGGELLADPVTDGGIASWRGVDLPDRPVSPGETWTITTVYRIPSQLGQLLDISIKDSVIATATVKLDSVAVPAGDTLMYLSVQEALGPVTLPLVDAGDSGVVELVGAQAASLVWSTGWQSYVSGASQARLVGRLRSGGATGAPRLAQMNWSISTRLQVRS